MRKGMLLSINIVTLVILASIILAGIFYFFWTYYHHTRSGIEDKVTLSKACEFIRMHGCPDVNTLKTNYASRTIDSTSLGDFCKDYMNASTVTKSLGECREFCCGG